MKNLFALLAVTCAAAFARADITLYCSVSEDVWAGADKDQAIIDGQRFHKEGSTWTTTETELITSDGITLPSTTKVEK